MYRTSSRKARFSITPTRSAKIMTNSSVCSMSEQKRASAKETVVGDDPGAIQGLDPRLPLIAMIWQHLKTIGISIV